MKKAQTLFSIMGALITMVFSFNFLVAVNVILLATPIVENTRGFEFIEYTGYTAVFGGVLTTLDGIRVSFRMAWPAFVGWLLILLAFLTIAVLFVVELIKSIGISKFPKALNIVSSGFFVLVRPAVSALLIAAAIFLMFAPDVYYHVNEMNPSVYTISGVWVFGIVLVFMTAILVPLPSIIMNIIDFVAGFFGKKKKKEPEVIDAQ